MADIRQFNCPMSGFDLLLIHAGYRRLYFIGDVYNLTQTQLNSTLPDNKLM